MGKNDLLRTIGKRKYSFSCRYLEELESIQRQPVLQRTEKVLIGVRKPYSFNIPELQKCVEHFQGANISSQFFNWKKTSKVQLSDSRYHSAWLKTSNRR